MLEAVDRKIIARLQANGRLTIAELAHDLGMSTSACHRRVKALEETGVITRYAAVVDRRAVGLKAVAFIIIKLESHGEDMLDRFEKAITTMDEVVECYAISGVGDYILKVAVSSANYHVPV